MQITSEKQIIDKDRIQAGCHSLNTAALDFSACAKLLNEAANICNKQALSVDNKTMQPVILELAAAISKYEAKIRAVTDRINSLTEQQYTQEKLQYQEYLNKKDANEVI